MKFRNEVLDSGSFNKLISDSKNNLEHILLVPSSSCVSCVDYDINVISDLSISSGYLETYYLNYSTDGEIKYQMLNKLDATMIYSFEEAFKQYSSFDYSFTNPTYFLVLNDKIIYIHETSLFYPEKSKEFLTSVGKLFK